VRRQLPVARTRSPLRRGLGLVSLASRDDLPVAGLEPESVLLGPVLVDREQSRHQTIPIDLTLSSSPWILWYPQFGLSVAICTTNAASPLLIGGRPRRFG